MADKSIDQLNAAEKIYPTDRFVVQQSGQAKSVSGQVMINYLTEAADGHGGIQSVVKVGTSGLVDTYRITLADTTVIDIPVTNGRSITGVSKTGTSGLVDTYTINMNDGTTSTFTVTNGAKGDKGDNTYVWIKYASQEPTGASHSIGDIPDNWIGIYSGNASSAPSDWAQYQWFKIKGEKGDTGSPATLYSQSVTYQVGDSGSIIPSGVWVSSVPVVSPGKYLWTKTEIQFNTGDPIVSYSVARMGIDGSGSVSSVSGVSPDESGNVQLDASDVGALPSSGGDLTGPINMNGQAISGLNPPTEDNQAANKGYVDQTVKSIFPVGYIYLSADSTSPAALFGGTWEQLKDRFLLGAGDSYDAGTTGGEAENTLTVNQIPSHAHNIGIAASDGSPGYYPYAQTGWGPTKRDTSAAGGSEPHNNMPPYLAVYMWKRVA